MVREPGDAADVGFISRLLGTDEGSMMGWFGGLGLDCDGNLMEMPEGDFPEGYISFENQRIEEMVGEF